MQNRVRFYSESKGESPEGRVSSTGLFTIPEKKITVRNTLAQVIEVEAQQFRFGSCSKLFISVEARFNICLSLLEHLKSLHLKGKALVKIKPEKIKVETWNNSKSKFELDDKENIKQIGEQIGHNVLGVNSTHTDMGALIGRLLLGSDDQGPDTGLQILLETTLGEEIIESVREVACEMVEEALTIDECIQRLSGIYEAWVDMDHEKQINSGMEGDAEDQPGMSRRL
jgi:hypothetical protein